MINNSPIFYNSFNLVVRRADRSSSFSFSFFKRVCFLVLLWGGGGFIDYMKQMQNTLMLILFDETSLTAIRTPQPILAFNHSA